MPITGSKESIEFAGRNNIPITPGASTRGLRDDIIRYYARCLAGAGHKITPDHLSLFPNVYVAGSKAEALKEAGPYFLYFNRTLFSHGNVTETNVQRVAGYVSNQANDYIRPENLPAAARLREEYRELTMEALERQAERIDRKSTRLNSSH